jgi:hypothetical protein
MNIPNIFIRLVIGQINLWKFCYYIFYVWNKCSKLTVDRWEKRDDKNTDFIISSPYNNLKIIQMLLQTSYSPPRSNLIEIRNKHRIQVQDANPFKKECQDLGFREKESSNLLSLIKLFRADLIWSAPNLSEMFSGWSCCRRFPQAYQSVKYLLLWIPSLYLWSNCC